MAPTLLPGDWILVDPDVPSVTPGDVVVALDPAHPGESIVKRLRAVEHDDVELTSDATGRSYALARSSLTGRAWFRYRPLARVGRIR